MHVSLPSVHLLKGVSLRPSNGSLNRQLPSILDGLIICYMAKRHIEKRSRIIRHNVSRETFSFFFFCVCEMLFLFFFLLFLFPLDRQNSCTKKNYADATSINFIEVLFETFHTCPGSILISGKGEGERLFYA